MVQTGLNFKTIEELTEWLTENNKKLSDFYIEEIVPPTTTYTSMHGGSLSAMSGCIGDITQTIIAETWEPKKITVKSLANQPSIRQIPLSESVNEPNVWYVDDYAFIEDACGTSKIVYKGNTLLMNVCESSGTAMVSLVLDVDGKVSSTKFKLDKACNSSDKYDMILSN